MILNACIQCSYLRLTVTNCELCVNGPMYEYAAYVRTKLVSHRMKLEA